MRITSPSPLCYLARNISNGNRFSTQAARQVFWQLPKNLLRATMSISAGELVVCCNLSAARKLKRAKNPGGSVTSHFLDSPPRKNARDAVANRCALHVWNTQVSNKRNVATGNDFSYRKADMCVVARAPSD